METSPTPLWFSTAIRFIKRSVAHGSIMLFFSSEVHSPVFGPIQETKWRTGTGLKPRAWLLPAGLVSVWPSLTLALPFRTVTEKLCSLPLVVVVVTFSSLVRILRECSITHSPPALNFFLVWKLARAHQFHFLGHDQSTVAQRSEKTVTKCSLTNSLWARFLIGSHAMPGQRHSQPTPTLLGQRSMHV